MFQPKPAESLYAELIRRGLPEAYARRTAGELDDHRADLIDDLRRQQSDDPEAAANSRLGEARALADRIARDYRRRSWFGRHPLVTFVVAPIPLLVAAVVFLVVSMEFGVEPLFGDSLRAWHTGLSDWNRLVAGAAICMAFYVVAFVVAPASIALGLSRLAVATVGNLRWAIAASLLIALAAGAIDYHLRLALGPNQSSFSLNGVPISVNPIAVIRHYSKPAPLAQFAAPLVMLGWVYATEWRRRQRALLAATSTDQVSRFAA